MRLRHIIKIKNDTPINLAELAAFTEGINKGDTAVVANYDTEHIKIPIDTKDLILENMRLIEKVIEFEQKQKEAKK